MRLFKTNRGQIGPILRKLSEFIMWNSTTIHPAYCWCKEWVGKLAALGMLTQRIIKCNLLDEYFLVSFRRVFWFLLGKCFFFWKSIFFVSFERIFLLRFYFCFLWASSFFLLCEYFFSSSGRVILFLAVFLFFFALLFFFWANIFIRMAEIDAMSINHRRLSRPFTNREIFSVQFGL